MRRFLPFALLISTAPLVASPVRCEASPPNIVVVIGDDHGWPYYGFQPSPQVLSNGQSVQLVVETPNLDTLASTGVTFPRGYATASVCLPSLQTALSAHGFEWSQWDRLLTEIHDRVPHSAQEQLERRENRFSDNLPRHLARHGYRTWEGGKLWAGELSDSGFTDGLATPIGPAPFFPSGGYQFGRDGWNTTDCGSTATSGLPCPALDPLRAFLDDTGAQPFFLWFAPMLPHSPFDAPSEYRQSLEESGLAWWEVDYLANVRWLDEVVGELIAELEVRNLRENTLVIYFSDNGWGLGLQFVAGFGRGKGTLYDIGFRTPVVFNQPGVVPEGVQYDDFVSVSDLPATILDYAGVPGPEPSMGASLRVRIHGGPPLGRDGLVMFQDGGAYVDDEWRYLQFDDGHEELYRIAEDPFEQVDVAAANPQLLAHYAALVDARRWDLEERLVATDVSGRLEDDLGAPIEGAQISLLGGPHRVRSVTGRDGWFRFGGVDPSDPLWLRRGLGLVSLVPAEAPPAPLLAPFSLPGLFVPLRGEVRRTLLGPFGASLSGRIVTPDGQPVTGAKLKIAAAIDGPNLSLVGSSGPDGSYGFYNLVPSASYRLRAKAKGHRSVSLRDIAILEEGQSLDLVLEPR